MWEYEFWNDERTEQILLYAYDFSDLKHRYPNVNLDNLIFVNRYYID